MSRCVVPALFLATIASFLGCSRSDDLSSGDGSAANAGGQDAATGDSDDVGASSAGGKKRTFQPISLGGSQAGPGAKGSLSGERQMSSVRQALDPLQILVGQWRGVTLKKIAGAVSVEQPEWVWDFQTDRSQPALVMTSSTSPYFKQARLTWLPEDNRYRLTATDKDDLERVYVGTFAEPVEDVPGDNNKLQRTFALELTQVVPDDLSRLARVVFKQQENNRYLLEVYDRRGDDFTKYDTVTNQRDGTSFAASLDDYGEKTCIISQGLGTMSVSHAGKTYWVCCTGCKAAFEEEPERWVAKAEQGAARE